MKKCRTIIVWLLVICIVISDLSLSIIASAITGDVPRYRQTDSGWDKITYGTHAGASSYKEAGCLPFSIANIIYALTGQDVSPQVIGDYAVETGSRGHNGTNRQLITDFFREKKQYDYGIEIVKEINKNIYTTETKEKLISYFNSGMAAIVHIAGHYMVLSKYDNDTGKFLLLDSYPVSHRETSANGARWLTWEETGGLYATEKMRNEKGEWVTVKKTPGFDYLCVMKVTCAHDQKRLIRCEQAHPHNNVYYCPDCSLELYDPQIVKGCPQCFPSAAVTNTNGMAIPKNGKITKGESFSLTANFQSTSCNLVTASGWFEDQNGRKYQKVEHYTFTGSPKNSYDCTSSKINSNLKFGSLAIGTYRYVIQFKTDNKLSDNSYYATFYSDWFAVVAPPPHLYCVV